MKKKLLAVLITLFTLLNTITNLVYAEPKEKVIVISMNRTSLTQFMEIPYLNKELSKRGYVGLMNIRGDKGTSDKRAYATIGAGSRTNMKDDEVIDFETANDDNKVLYESSVGQRPGYINNISINREIKSNVEEGEYSSTLGSLGQALKENKLSAAVIGNADIGTEEIELNRDIALMAMDNFGRVQKGNIDNINIEDNTMPFGIRTDYQKLVLETKKYYDNSDVVFVELGDTYRLDLYRDYLNKKTYAKTQKEIYKNVSDYLNEVSNIINQNDKVYILSSFPGDLDYKNKRRLSPVLLFDGQEKGLLKSATTRRDGIIGNVDIGVDILNNFDVKSDKMIGRSLEKINKDDNIDYLNSEYEKIVSIANIRMYIINTFIGCVALTWLIAIAAMFIRKKIPNNKIIFKPLREIIKFGLIMPLVFLISPIYNFKTPLTITLGIIITTAILYLIGIKLFKNDIKQMCLYSFLAILAILIDAATGSYLMQNGIMSYDAIVGARYYGVGNEYEGITIGATIFTLAVLLNYKKIPKWAVMVISLITLFISGYPGMGANVGGSISNTVAFLFFILLIYDIKLDFKKIVLLGIMAMGAVGIFAVIDIVAGTQSHLSVFINQILVEGPGAIVQTFARKIAMNVKIAQTSAWSNILFLSIIIIVVMMFRPPTHLKNLANKYPYIFKGWIASLVGCIVTLLVNDSGIVAAATAIIYVLIPLLVITIDTSVLNKND
jgi:hypothetical protein